MSSGAGPASRLAWASIGVNVVLSLLNLGIALASGSLAVAAELVHNLSDLVSSIAVLAGIKVSERRSRSFPYGLHKVENLVASGVAILILVTAYEIGSQALRGSPTAPRVNAGTVSGVALSTLLPWVYGRYLMQKGRELNSPSLMASAREYEVHMFSSGLIIVTMLVQSAGLRLDRVAALLIVLLIVRTGWDLLSNAMRVLLDASLDPETLDRVRGILAAEPSVSAVRSLVGRNAGRYRFIEAELELRVADLQKAHLVTERLEQAIRGAVPYIERVLIHYEPRSRENTVYAFPLADEAGTVSQHFGEAPLFALVTLSKDGVLLERRVLANPHRDEQRAKGIRVAEWLVKLRVDQLVVREELEGKGPAYVLADAGVRIVLTQAANLATALDSIRREQHVEKESQ
ncbi:MAG TPA: cation diffusion facilitator family transporter [Anaerolineae bacterium]|nr:cation diffusion facilitator family transporter [Anaerolineae bacterium]